MNDLIIYFTLVSDQFHLPKRRRSRVILEGYWFNDETDVRTKFGLCRCERLFLDLYEVVRLKAR